ncbi:hypothetical protein CLOP_g10952 [Closterium sp. NIES-67]|nr:hypothetical protein CLOP_g10952 [Closterium sp. NIES-67]
MQPVLDEMRDIFSKLQAGGLVYPELVQCVEIVIRLPESWSALAINLNSQQSQWNLELGYCGKETYMEQPEGYNDGSGRVWKLKKALYGLKQAPRQWYIKLREGAIALAKNPVLHGLTKHMKVK